MISGLWNGISGVNSNQQALSVQSNNITNVNTIGYKSDSISFEDLLYENGNGNGTTTQTIGKNFNQGNLKITDKEDLKIFKSFKRENTYVGIGFDVHRLVPKRKLYLGGLKIKSNIGGIQDKLKNKNFLSNAPEDVVSENKDRLEGLNMNLEKIRQSISLIEKLTNNE